MSKSIADVLIEVMREHKETSGMQVSSGVTCRCGYWNGAERAGVDRPVGLTGLLWHQTQMIEQALKEAGYGSQHDAWERGASDAIERENTQGAVYKAAFDNPYPATEGAS